MEAGVHVGGFGFEGAAAAGDGLGRWFGAEEFVQRVLGVRVGDGGWFVGVCRGFGARMMASAVSFAVMW